MVRRAIVRAIEPSGPLRACIGAAVHGGIQLDCTGVALLRAHVIADRLRRSGAKHRTTNGAIAMCTNAQTRRTILAAVLGALGGGLVVAIATQAIPEIMSQMMPGMMRNMMAHKGERGCSPAEM